MSLGFFSHLRKIYFFITILFCVVVMTCFQYINESALVHLYTATTVVGAILMIYRCHYEGIVVPLRGLSDKRDAGIALMLACTLYLSTIILNNVLSLFFSVLITFGFAWIYLKDIIVSASKETR